jgi:chromate reductase
MADDTLTFAGYAGSLRKNSYNRMLLRALAKAAPAGVTIRELDISDIPLYNMDLEDNPPPSVIRLREEIRTADGLLIVTPEHNGTISAVTKVVIEWASRPPRDSVLEGKPAAIAGASTGYYGTVRAQAALRQIATIEEVYFMVDPELRVGRAAEKFDAQGELLDEALKAELTAFLDAFANWTRTIKNRRR